MTSDPVIFSDFFHKWNHNLWRFNVSEFLQIPWQRDRKIYDCYYCIYRRCPSRFLAYFKLHINTSLWKNYIKVLISIENQQISPKKGKIRRKLTISREAFSSKTKEFSLQTLPKVPEIKICSPLMKRLTYPPGIQAHFEA